MRLISARVLLAACLLLLPSIAFAQKACVVLSSDIGPYREALRGFKDAYRGHASEWVLDDDADAVKVAGEVASSDCSAVVAMGSRAFKHLRLRVANRPIIFAMTLSPSVAGIAGREITGVYLEPSPHDTLAALKKVLPRAAMVGVLYSSASDVFMAEAQRVAGTLGLKLNAAAVRSVGDMARQAPNLVAHSDVVWMIPDPVTASQVAFQTILEYSLKHGVPVFALSQKNVSTGALAALTTDYFENGKQAGALASRVVRGTPASSIAPEFAKTSGLTINLKAASRLGFSIPESVINDAVEIYR
jgi:putative ABC transport system substrate-binding protein